MGCAPSKEPKTVAVVSETTQPPPSEAPKPEAPKPAAVAPKKEAEPKKQAEPTDTNITATPEADVPALEPGEQAFELAVPEGCEAGSRLKISLPGIEQRVVIEVPEGAQPGKSISFTLKGLPDAKEAEAASVIQAITRGHSERKKSPFVYTPRGHAAPPHPPTVADPQASPAKPTFDPSLYPSLTAAETADSDEEEEAEAEAPAPAPAPSYTPVIDEVSAVGGATVGAAAAVVGRVGSLGRSLTNLLGVTTPAVAEEGRV